MKNHTFHTLAVLFLCTLGVLFSSNSFAQGKISGKVTDTKNGETLPGVSISVKGTQKGAITDINGDYSLTVNQGETTLLFSLVGYVLQEVEIGNRSTIDFAM